MSLSDTRVSVYIKKKKVGQLWSHLRFGPADHSISTQGTFLDKIKPFPAWYLMEGITPKNGVF